MRCPKCGCQEDKVIDSRASREGATIRRRRECTGCSHRFTTYEELEHEGLMVLKRDGRHEEFSREKLLSGLKNCLLYTSLAESRGARGFGGAIGRGVGLSTVATTHCG